MNGTDLVNPYEGDANLAARLFAHIHAFLYEQTGQLLVEEIDLADVWNVLDIGCGLGGWGLDMARVHQDMDIVGLDSDAHVLVLARMDGRAYMLDNITFVDGDMRAMTDLEDNSFDLVHARFISPVISAASWPVILRELMRVCRPGGNIVWTETSSFVSNSAACRRWCDLVRQAIWHPDAVREAYQLMDMMLTDASWKHIKHFKTEIDLSTDSQAHTRIYRNLTYLLSMVQLHLTAMRIVSVDDLDQITREMILDLYSDAYTACWSLVTVVGEKPLL